MAIMMNSKGTTEYQFKIGAKGPTIYSDSTTQKLYINANPNTATESELNENEIPTMNRVKGKHYTKDETYTKQETLEQIDIHKLINKTYSELATLKANNGLVAGQKYRITDYVTKTNGKCNGVENDAISTEHPFDVIVTAISNNEFSENARAIHHTGANYFSQSKLEAWRLWYSFDNDIYRFEWADTRNGKGVIYRMIDEFQNDLPYDFKNIQFKRYKITGVTDQRQSSLIGKYLGFYENYNVTSDSNDYVWRYTFSKRADNSDLSLFEIDSSTFNQNSYVKQVVIGEYITDNPTYRCKQALNNIVMEVEALIVDVQMGKGSHHNTWIGNEDIDYCYFNAMFRQNILYGEINHTRADECFEKNVIGDGAFTTYASCWNKFSHHFSRNIGIDMQSNDFEGQVGETKFPLHFTRNHISNMWDDVNASSHTTFNRCEFGYVVTATFGGNGTWDGVKSIMLWNTTININNLFGTTLGRLEYVTISQGTNGYNILNLTTGALNGSSGKPLIINLSDISNLLATSFEKNITFAWHNLLNAKCLVYSVKVYDKINNLVYDTNYAGIINTANNNVTWEEVGDIGQLKALINTKADTSYVDGKFEEVGQMFEIVGNEVLKKADKSDTYTKDELKNRIIIPLEENGSTTAGTWLAKTSLISALEDGDIFIYKIAVKGASTTTLKINSLAAKNVYRYGTTKLTTQYGVGQYLLLTYNSTNDCFRVINDADVNSYAYLRQYQTGSTILGADKYPLLSRYYNTDKSASPYYVTEYARYHTDAYLDISDGSINASSLKENGTELSTKYVLASNVGTGSGNIPSLDSNGKLPTSVLPSLAITDTFVVNSQNAMLALDAQVGDVCVRTDLSKNYILKTAGASTLANWQELLTPATGVTSVRVQAGKGLSSSVSAAQTSTLDTTISIASGYTLPTTSEWNAKANTSDLGTQVTYTFSNGTLRITTK